MLPERHAPGNRQILPAFWPFWRRRDRNRQPEVQKIESQAKAEAQRMEAESQANAQRLATQGDADIQRLQTKAEIRRL
jgi:hypothetical protein